MSAKRNPFQRRCKIDMVGVNLEVIWEMSAQLVPWALMSDTSGECRFKYYIALLPNDNLQRNAWKP
jgi:hypothetical protein